MRRVVRRVTGAIHGALFRSRADPAAVVPAAVLALALFTALVPPRSGPLALALVVEPHIFLAVLLVFAPIALWRRARTLGVTLAVLALVGGCVFGSEWISLPGAGAARHDVSVLTWNVEYGTRTPAEQAAQLQGVTADLVALEEIEPDAAAAIGGDAQLTTRYPYRAMAPQWGAWGLAFLSRYPVSSVDSTNDPACLDLEVDAPQGRIHVIVAHPNHGDIDRLTPLTLLTGYDPSGRDESIGRIRTHIDSALGSGDRLLVVGDFNTTPSEPAYGVLARGLRDTHVEVGEGPGWTWRPSRITFLPVAVLRIDLQLTAGALHAASTSIDCSLPGDHCRLYGDYEID